jgi:hypothetical protein
MLAACVSSKEIARFATQSAEGASFQRLLDDYQSAPLRQARFVGQGNQADDPVGPWLRQNVAQREEQVKRTKLLLAAVGSYMRALGALADNEAASADTELGALIDASVDGKWLPEEQAGAAKSLVGIVADAALRKYRQRQLATLIQRANAPLQSILQHLQSLDAQFEVSERAVQEQMDTYYRFLEKTAGAREPVAAQLVRDRKADDDVIEGQRLEALHTHGDTFRDIAQGHQHLYDNLGHLSVPEVRATIEQSARRIGTLVSQLKQLRTA